MCHVNWLPSHNGSQVCVKQKALSTLLSFYDAVIWWHQLLKNQCIHEGSNPHVLFASQVLRKGGSSRFEFVWYSTPSSPEKRMVSKTCSLSSDWLVVAVVTDHRTNSLCSGQAKQPACLSEHLQYDVWKTISMKAIFTSHYFCNSAYNFLSWRSDYISGGGATG